MLVHLVDVGVVDDEVTDADKLVVQEVLSDICVVDEVIGEGSVVAGMEMRKYDSKIFLTTANNCMKISPTC